MPKAIEKRMKDLSLSPKSKEKTNSQKKRHAKRRKEYWIYGYHLKNRIVRRLCEKFNLPYQTRPWPCLFGIQSYLIARCRVHYSARSIYHCGKLAKFLVFMEDDGRKREHMNRFTEEQMDRVRRALMLPEGTKPKWYDVNDRYEEQDDFSSEDEDMPDVPCYANRPEEDFKEEPTSKKRLVDDLEESDEDYNSEDNDDYFEMLYGSDNESDAEESDEPSVGSVSNATAAM